jgi:hypothetical protein
MVRGDGRGDPLMWDPEDIAAMRVTLRHAADHLSEVRDDVDGPYHEKGAAPADVITTLCPLLNAIETYVHEVRHALTVMAAGGLADDGQGDWWVGTDGPYDTLEEALTRSEEDYGGPSEGAPFVIQNSDCGHDPGEDLVDPAWGAGTNISGRLEDVAAAANAAAVAWRTREEDPGAR